MRYLSGGKYGNNSGILRNVSVCLLDGTQMTLGPINEADRKAWAQQLANAPFSQAVNQPNSSTGAPSFASPFSSVSGGAQNPQTSAPTYAPQPGTTQPGQYFSGGYTSVPADQPFPFATTSNNSTSNTNSFTSSLLNLIKPFVASSSTPTITITPITGGSTGTIVPQQAVQVSVIPATTTVSYNPPQTFVQQYMSEERPSASVPPTVSNATFATILATLKSALIRLAELLRML